MASIRKLGSKWRAEIARGGVRRAKVFATKTEAKDRASRQEYQIVNGDRIAGAQKIDDIMDRNAQEISPSKRGHRWEMFRLEAMR